MPTKNLERIVIYLLLFAIVFGSNGLNIYDGQQGNAMPVVGLRGNYDGSVVGSPQALSFSPVQEGPMNVFPGQLVNESYFLGSTSPSADYYEVTVTLNGSSYETLDAFPTYLTSLNPAGYYLLFSFVMPNDEPGMWWNVGYQILPITITTLQESRESTILVTGVSIWMQYPTESIGGNYIVKGGANFSFSTNATAIQIYPANPQYTIIVSAQVNSWKFVDGTVEVFFSLYENIGTENGQTAPPSMTVLVSYNANSSETEFGSLISSPGYSITLIQGNGAYLIGITSSQIAEITNSLNQSLSIPISQLNAAIVSINGNIATLQTSFGSMKTKLDEINATIISIENGQVTLATDFGDMQTSLASLFSTITSISAGQAAISTEIGRMTASLNSLNASFEGMNGSEAVIKTDIGSVTTSLSSINATTYAIHQGMAEMNTSIGDVQVSLRSLNSSIVEVSGYTAEIMTYAGELNTSLSELNASIFSSNVGIPWLNGTYTEIETSLGNISGTITNVSNDTASISTDLGVVKASVNSIKSFDSQITSADPPSLFELVVIALLGGILVVPSLAMLSSRSTLKIMGDKVK